MMELFAAFMLTSQEPERTLPLAEVEQAEPLVLAPKVLPPETAGRITGGWVRRWWVPGQVYRALFWERSLPDRDGICARRVHVAELANRTAPGHPNDPATILTLKPLEGGVQYGPSYPEPASETRCAQLTGYIAGPDNQIEGQLATIARLTEAMRLAEGSADLPFALDCDPQGAPNACDDPRRALAELPLGRLLSVGPSLVRPRDASTPPGPRVFVDTGLPQPWSVTEIAFDVSGPGARSWMVTLIGVDRVEAVRLRSAMIIRH